MIVLEHLQAFGLGIDTPRLRESDGIMLGAGTLFLHGIVFALGVAYEAY